MKIWKIHIFWAKDNGVYHLHRDPKKKGEKAKDPLLTADELQNLLKEDKSHAALPRHTPEELDRFIEAVRKVYSPENPLFNLPPPKEEEATYEKIEVKE